MALSNAELTDEVRDLKGRVKELEATVEAFKWQALLDQAVSANG